MAKANSKPTPPVHNLSFVGRRSKADPSIHFWQVKPTGDYRADCERGTELGLEFLEFREQAHDTYLSLIIRDMPRKLTGLEIGFLTMVDIAASGGVYAARGAGAYWKRCEAERLSGKTQVSAR